MIHKKLEIVSTLTFTFIFYFLSRNAFNNFNYMKIVASTENCEASNNIAMFSAGYYITNEECETNFVKINRDFDKNVCCDKRNSDKIIHNQQYINFIENLKTVKTGNCIELRMKERPEIISGALITTFFLVVLIFDIIVESKSKEKILCLSNLFVIMVSIVYVYFVSKRLEFFSYYYFVESCYKIFYTSFFFSMISNTAYYFGRN